MGKRLLCEIARKEGQLEWDETLLMNYYKANRIDYTSKSLFFNIAVKVGLEGQLCEEVYPRCILALPELLRILRRQGISFDIPGQDRDCQVYFLWKKKKPSSSENEVPLDTDADANDTVVRTRRLIVRKLSRSSTLFSDYPDTFSRLTRHFKDHPETYK